MKCKKCKKLKEQLKKAEAQIEIYSTYTDQIEFTEEDIEKLDKLTTIS